MFDAHAVVNALSSKKVRYAIIGGVAMRFHASSILTQDIDIAYARDTTNIRRIVSALGPFRPRLRGIGEAVPFHFDVRTMTAGLNFTFETDVGDVDLLGAVPGFKDFDEILRYCERRQLGAATINVLTLEGLLIAKKASGRPKDMLSLPELEALLEVRRLDGV